MSIVSTDQTRPGFRDYGDREQKSLVQGPKTETVALVCSKTVVVVPGVDGVVLVVLPPLTTGFTSFLLLRPVLVGQETPAEVSAYTVLLQAKLRHDEVFTDLTQTEVTPPREVTLIHPSVHHPFGVETNPQKPYEKILVPLLVG